MTENSKILKLLERCLLSYFILLEYKKIQDNRNIHLTRADQSIIKYFKQSKAKIRKWNRINKLIGKSGEKSYTSHTSMHFHNPLDLNPDQPAI